MIQTTSPLLSKKLREIGYPQECVLFWYAPEAFPGKATLSHANNFGDMHLCLDPDEYAAPTAEEILEKLPNEVTIKVNDIPYIESLCIKADCNDEFEVSYIGTGKISSFYDRSLVVLLAKMYIYLKEQKLI